MTAEFYVLSFLIVNRFSTYAYLYRNKLKLILHNFNSLDFILLLIALNYLKYNFTISFTFYNFIIISSIGYLIENFELFIL